MDILSIIKIKNLITEDLSSDKEKYFYSLFNNLTMINQGTSLYFIKIEDEKNHDLDKHYFHYHISSGNLWCSKVYVLESFMSKFNVESFEEASKELKKIAKDLNVNDITSSFKLRD